MVSITRRIMVKRRHAATEGVFMAKTAIVTDSNSGITQKEGKELGIFVLPMPFLIDDASYFEDIDLTQEEFYVRLSGDSNVSPPSPASGTFPSFGATFSKITTNSCISPCLRDWVNPAPRRRALSQDFGGKVHSRQQSAHFHYAKRERIRRFKTVGKGQNGQRNQGISGKDPLRFLYLYLSRHHEVSQKRRPSHPCRRGRSDRF